MGSTVFKVHMEEGQLWVDCERYPIFTIADNFKQLRHNIQEAMALYAEVEGTIDIAYELNFTDFFKSYRALNAKVIAERAGLSPSLLSHFVSGRRNPSEAQVKKIIGSIQEIGKELNSMNLVMGDR